MYMLQKHSMLDLKKLVILTKLGTGFSRKTENVRRLKATDLLGIHSTTHLRTQPKRRTISKNGLSKLNFECSSKWFEQIRHRQSYNSSGKSFFCVCFGFFFFFVSIFLHYCCYRQIKIIFWYNLCLYWDTEMKY